jgi:hypothetical protein
MLGGDVMWLLSKIDDVNQTLYQSLGDGGFIHAYLLFTAAIWIGRLLGRAQVSGAGLAPTASAIGRNLAAGRFNALAAAPIILLLALFVLAEKGVTYVVFRTVGDGVTSGLVAGGLSLLLKAMAWKLEKQREALSVYRDEFQRRLKKNLHQTADDAAALQGLSATLHLSPEDVRVVEGRVLREWQEELRGRLELLHDWAAVSTVLLSGIRALAEQVELKIEAGRPGRGNHRPRR